MLKIVCFILFGILAVNASYGTVGNGGTDSTVDALLFVGTDLYVGGEFEYVNGLTVLSPYLAGFDTLTSAWFTPAVGVSPSDYVYALATDGAGTLYFGGEFLDVGINEYNYVAYYDTATSQYGAITDGVDVGVDGTVKALAYYNPYLFIGGYFDGTYDGEVSSYGIIAFDTFEGQWVALNNQDLTEIYSLTIGSIYLFAGGYMDYLTGGVYAANNVGQLDATSLTWYTVGTFGAIDSDYVYSLAYDGTSIWMGGDGSYTLWNYDTATEVLTYWDYIDGPDGSVDALAIYGSTVYIGGDFFGCGGASSAWYLCTYSTSSLVYSPAYPGTPSSYVFAIVVSATGQAYIGGDFLSVPGINGGSGIATFNAGGSDASSVAISLVLCLISLLLTLF